jgi:hypothetical protein
MPLFMILNSHESEVCEAMEEDAGSFVPPVKGSDFYCTCPAGEHAYYMFLEGDSAEQVLSFLPPSLKLGKTRAVGVDVWQL